MNQVEIKSQRLSKNEARIVQREIKKSPNITGYSLRELLSLRNVFKAYISKEFSGACANFDFGRDWTELSAYIVLSKFRGQGVGKKLFAAAWSDAVMRRKNIYIVSRSPAMIKIFKGSGLKIYRSFWNLPWPVIAHEIKFALNWYRIKEFTRKLSMKKSGKFIFGIKLMHS